VSAFGALKLASASLPIVVSATAFRADNALFFALFAEFCFAGFLVGECRRKI
jgi:hypothetical protein